MMYPPSHLLRPSDFRPRYEKSNVEPFTNDTAVDYSRIVHSMPFRRLQGKTQLFPSSESPLLRNRLTHSLEVADIAIRIVRKINADIALREEKIDPSIVMAAAIAHDLGHPPFGHSGEIALNEFMSTFGSFEANAQTLRILTRLENRFTKETTKAADLAEIYREPLGLNLTLRTIASVVKYDYKIRNISNSHTPPKGYYEDDSAIVETVKRSITEGRKDTTELYTIECAIMDVADDIAYSTYDLEDCMIAGIANPLDVMSVDVDMADKIATDMNTKLSKLGYNAKLDPKDISIILYRLFNGIIKYAPERNPDFQSSIKLTHYVVSTYGEAQSFSRNALFRRRLTETLIDKAISAISVAPDPNECGPLSRIHLSTDYRITIETLKRFNFYSVIKSPRLQVFHQKAQVIVRGICEAIYRDKTNSILPREFRKRLELALGPGQTTHTNENATIEDKAFFHERMRRRTICDYVSSLTDGEAIALHSRLKFGEQTSVFGL